MKIKFTDHRFPFQKRLTFFIMRIFIILFCTTVFGLNSEKTFSQVKISIDEDQLVSVNHVFRIIKKQTNYGFIYPKTLFKNNPKIQLKKGDIELTKLLNQTLESSNLKFEVSNDKTITIKEAIKLPPDNETVLVQQTEVKGTVTDETGQPLAGANILEKGTKNGAQADFDGNFSINLTNKNATLVISYVGFATQEISISGQTNIAVTLKESASGLDEVVLIGYGSVRKGDLTGAVSSVSSADLNRTVNQSFAEALDGRASGVKILSGEGTPGGNVSVRIRGGTSISASNEPLYVVDGFPIVVESNTDLFNTEINAGTSTNPLAGIDPKDIESLEILKDASATAIYGSRGANGVVIITTKKGNVGAPKLSFETSLSSKVLSKKLDLLGPVEYAQYRLSLETDPNSEVSALLANPESFANQGVDWQDEVYRTAILQNYRIGMSGGSQDLRYNVSLGAFLDEGIIKLSDFDRYNARINLNGDLSEKLRFTAVITGAYSEQTGAPTGGSNNERAGVVTQVTGYPPLSFNFNDATSDLSGGQNFSPLTTIEESDILNKNDFFQANVSFQYNITDNLSFNTLAGITVSNQKNSSYFSTNTGAGAFVGGSAIISHNANRSWVNENTLTYKKSFGDHLLTVLGGVTAQSATIESFRSASRDFSIEDLGFNNISIGNIIEIPTSNLEKWSLGSGLARVNYSYNNRYFVSASFRADGSSRFATGKKWGYFPAASVAWKLKNESFLENLNVISNLKIRGGFGITGNQEVARYQSITAMGTGLYGFGLDNNSADIIAYTDRVANPDLTWETTEQYNIGLDFGFLDSKITGTIDWYTKETTDMLLAVNLIPSAGIISPALQNIGSLSNKGLEIALNTINIESENFKWSTGFNISFNKNKILNLGSFDQIFVDVQGANHQIVNEVLLTPGESIGTFYGYETAGIYGSDAVDGTPGSRIFVDQPDPVTGIPDGVINDDDRVILGNALPKHFGGFTNDFSYKNIDLSVFFNWSYGNKVYNANRVLFEEHHEGRNRSTAILNAWTPTNQDTDVPAIGQGEVSRLMDRYIEDGSFLRLKSLTLGYTFDDSLLSKTPFTSARISASGQNLFTITDYQGYNPEANVSPIPVTPGIDWGAYPLSKIYTVSLNITF